MSVYGISDLRRAVNLFNNCREDFNQQFDDPADLLKLWHAFSICGWDITPDQWEPRQIYEALKGIAPRWDDREQPLYSDEQG